MVFKDHTCIFTFDYGRDHVYHVYIIAKLSYQKPYMHKKVIEMDLKIQKRKKKHYWYFI